MWRVFGRLFWLNEVGFDVVWGVLFVFILNGEDGVRVFVCWLVNMFVYDFSRGWVVRFFFSF